MPTGNRPAASLYYTSTVLTFQLENSATSLLLYCYNNTSYSSTVLTKTNTSQQIVGTAGHSAWPSTAVRTPYTPALPVLFMCCRRYQTGYVAGTRYRYVLNQQSKPFMRDFGKWRAELTAFDCIADVSNTTGGTFESFIFSSSSPK